ncbi:hypothetical protein ACHAXA_000696 [Cyclostephanos tholiformis]|uniref:Uncharacterized protein n=1 Tax=Cyclostephanos tholiformis TaxID=382380 RepID=A0ABD3R795_9STRA
MVILMWSVPSIANVAVVVLVLVLVLVVDVDVTAASSITRDVLQPERRLRRRLLRHRRHRPRGMPEDVGTAAAASSSFLLPSPSPRRRRSPAAIPPPSRVIGPDSRLPSSPSDVREIMDLIRRTYPDANENVDENDVGVGWSRTRNYLYRHRASCRRAAPIDPTSPSEEMDDRSGGDDRNGSGREPLTTRSVSLVLSFLDEAFPNRPDLQARILKNTPRILGRWESINSRLWPTVEFLRGLYGRMTIASCGGGVGGIDDDDCGMFHEAIYRNTDLLLVRGVGYAASTIECEDDDDDDRAPRLRRNGRARARRRDVDDVAGAVAHRDLASMTMSDIGGAYDGDDTDDGTNNAIEGYLRTELGALLSSSDVAKLKRDRPTIFQLSLDGTVRPVVEYLRSLLFFETDDGGGDDDDDDDDISSMVDNDGTVQSLHSLSSSSSRWNGKAGRVLKRVVTNHPTLLQLDVESNLRPTVSFLRDSCDFDDAELAMVISATPGLLGLSVSRNIGPTIGYIRDILADGDCGEGTPHDDSRKEDREGREDELRRSLRRCILKHPQILSLSLDNLRAKREYFDEIDRVGTPSQTKDDVGRGKAKKMKTTLAARIVATAPSTYSLSLSEYRPQGGIFGKIVGRTKVVTECECKRNTLSDNLREYPVILTLSLEDNIIPTLSFFNMTGYVRLDVNGIPQINESPIHQQKVVIRSRYIATSLYNRLLPRWHFLLQEREKQQLSWHAHMKSERASDTCTYAAAPAPWEISSSSNSAPLPPLHLLSGANDEVFCREMKLSLTEYFEFKEEAVGRLKFASQFDRWLKTGRPIDLSVVSSREK